LINLFEFEREAERRIPPAHWGYIAGGANDEVTLGANRDAFDRILIRYRTMVDVSSRDLRTTVLGAAGFDAVLVAPTAMQKLAHNGGRVCDGPGGARGRYADGHEHHRDHRLA
jgi:isopentenyl diphosphate isomerase/L-lactate dehydrogenase-like FMN-dependent dehydrogenase